MKIIVDNKIPYIEGVFEPYAEVVYLPGHLTTAEAVKDADALVTRTRTLCSEEVLRGSKVKFIATATIGFDHIDIDYCRQAGIEWVNAPGCNAESVNQYMASALFSYAQRKQLALKGKTIGIVGVGQVGSRVAKTGEILGMDVLLNDPPRARREGPSQFVSLQTIRESADIVSFHVPLNMAGVDRTFHMVDTAFLQGLKRQPLIINTCRGEVFETGPVCDARLEGLISGVIVDCWENEPGLNLGFLNLTDYGTAHIAGYSKDGKANGTRSSVRAISRFFGLGIDTWEPGGVERPAKPRIEISGAGLGEQEILARAVLATYEIENDDRLLRGNPQLFEKLRGDYALRREFDSYHVVATGIADSTLEKLRGMGFSVGDK
ncbi:MAG: 4-phosphoerythronate dehydrogenase [Gammaproteobacteria bacterium]|nr:4-phosphoerythronate dehydrogenase [Gammaproteobacteria bacterium]